MKHITASSRRLPQMRDKAKELIAISKGLLEGTEEIEELFAHMEQGITPPYFAGRVGVCNMKLQRQARALKVANRTSGMMKGPPQQIKNLLAQKAKQLAEIEKSITLLGIAVESCILYMLTHEEYNPSDLKITASIKKLENLHELHLKDDGSLVEELTDNDNIINNAKLIAEAQYCGYNN